MAELSIFVPALKRKVTARETGSNKKSASKSCALSLVRQLFHLKVIEAFSGTLKKKKDEQLKPYPVKLDPQLIDSVDEVIKELELPVVNPRNIKVEPDAAPMSLIVSAAGIILAALLILLIVGRCESLGHQPGDRDTRTPGEYCRYTLDTAAAQLECLACLQHR